MIFSSIWQIAYRESNPAMTSIILAETIYRKLIAASTQRLSVSHDFRRMQSLIIGAQREDLNLIHFRPHHPQ
jgi:hypothetical protein